MNAKQAKRIRRALNEHLAQFDLTVRTAEHADIVVASKNRGGLLRNTETGEIIKGALQRHLTKGCPRDMYKRVKNHVEQQRIAK